MKILELVFLVRDGTNGLKEHRFIFAPDTICDSCYGVS